MFFRKAVFHLFYATCENVKGIFQIELKLLWAKGQSGRGAWRLTEAASKQRQSQTKVEGELKEAIIKDILQAKPWINESDIFVQEWVK